MVTRYERSSNGTERKNHHRAVIKDLTEIVTISQALRATAADALKAAQALPE